MREVEMVEIKDLKEGDEIIVPFMSSFRRFKLLATPKMSKMSSSRYSAVRCSVEMDKTTTQWTDWKGRIRTQVNRTYKFSPPDKHNTRISLNLNYRQILRIKE